MMNELIVTIYEVNFVPKSLTNFHILCKVGGPAKQQ